MFEFVLGLPGGVDGLDNAGRKFHGTSVSGDAGRSGHVTSIETQTEAGMAWLLARVWCGLSLQGLCVGSLFLSRALLEGQGTWRSPRCWEGLTSASGILTSPHVTEEEQVWPSSLWLLVTYSTSLSHAPK